VNIAAVMAALQIDTADHLAKYAAVVVACRANRYTASVELPTRRVAADMGVNYTTAQRALNRAVKAGFLGVDKPRGRRPIWQVPRDIVTTPPRDDVTTTSRHGHDHLMTVSRTEESLDLTSGVAAASFRHPARRGRSVEKPEPRGGSTYAHFADWTGSYQERVDAERDGRES
jgi:hypothetical protein